MKKIILFLTLGLILAACSDQETENIEEQQTLEEKNTQEQNDEDVNTNTENSEDSSKTNEVSLEENTDSAPDLHTNTEEVEEAPQEPLYTVNSAHWGIEPITDDANEKIVLLTIDDAPDKYGLEMAQTLKKLKVHAIFFVNGHFIDSDEEKVVLKEIYDLGFEIGNHTWNHKNLKKLTEEQQKKEIVELNDAIEQITGERPKFFRAPFGSNTDYSRQIVAEEKMTLMNWSYGYDWNKEYMNADAIADIMVNTNLLRNGSNLLMHDRKWTNEALETIVKGLQEKGYEFVNPDLIKTPREK